MLSTWTLWIRDGSGLARPSSWRSRQVSDGGHFMVLSPFSHTSPTLGGPFPHQITTTWPCSAFPNAFIPPKGSSVPPYPVFSRTCCVSPVPVAWLSCRPPCSHPSCVQLEAPFLVFLNNPFVPNINKARVRCVQWVLLLSVKTM
jgi:hypothetical protein